jgi:hydroxysqualene synthase
MHPVSVDHYENFPVASVLCPPSIRPAVGAIYRFARTADDIADEGDAMIGSRLADLGAYRDDLQRIYAGEQPSSRWAAVFAELDQARRRHALPFAPLAALLDAFIHDAPNPRHGDRDSLLWYCARSANPVGRLLLHLYRVDDPISLAQSDDICTALQLINFWQDLGIDLPRGRVYLPEADLLRWGLRAERLWPLRNRHDAAALQALVAELCAWAVGLMQRGAPLALRLPGRAGWELRLVVQGGLRIAEKLARHDHRSWQFRPRLRAFDLPPLLWRAARMGASGPRALPATQ